MKKRTITRKQLSAFAEALHDAERSPATIKKYTADLERFWFWLLAESKQQGMRDPLQVWHRKTPLARQRRKRVQVSRDKVLTYKAYLLTKCSARSVNVTLAALNAFFNWQGWHELKVSACRIQRAMFLDENCLLEKDEYLRLLTTAQARKQFQLALVMETLCSTGIRVGELQWITVSAAQRGLAEVDCKGKRRTVFLPTDLCEKLRSYCRAHEITSGAIFITRSGKCLDPGNVWREMKKLCEDAKVAPSKVFPHNLRHLFARTFYAQTKDIVRLADLLGHSSIQTTRIYTRSSGREEQRQVGSLGLVMHNWAADKLMQTKEKTGQAIMSRKTSNAGRKVVETEKESKKAERRTSKVHRARDAKADETAAPERASRSGQAKTV